MNSTPKKQAETGSPSAAPKGPGVSRRDFLKGAAVLAGASALAACAPAIPTGAPTAEVTQTWDKEVDVVVVGTGTASLAALVAHDAGSKVLMLDRAPVFGGHTAVSGGGLATPANFVQRAEGVDSREDDLAYARAVVARAGINPVRDDMIVKFFDTCNSTIDYFIKIGVDKWKGSGLAYSSYYPDSYPGHRKKDTYLSYEGNGKGLIAAIREQINGRGIEVLLETPAKRLIYAGNSAAGDGQVIGIIAQTPTGGEIAIKARKGVVIGTGGFEHNKEMKEHFLRNPLYYLCSPPTHMGDGHLMAMAVGAQLRGMNEIWGYCGYNVNKEDGSGVGDTGMFRGKPGAIVVNKHGERIGNEAAAYENFGRAFGTYDTGTIEWRNVPSYAIFDSGYTSRYALPGAKEVGEVPAFFKQADTLDALAGQLGINVDGLMAQVNRFNENARNGVDPEWHRGENNFDHVVAGDATRTDIKNVNLAPLETGPYYGTEIWPGTMGGTNGGALTNVNGQVVNVWGNVIPRLYATGNCMATIWGGAYPWGGSTLGPGFTFSYIGGNHVAALKSWDAA